MREEYLMALDAGSGAGRCFLIGLDGARTCSAYREWGYTQPPEAGPMASAFDPQTWWHTLAGAIRDTLAKANVEPSQIVGVSSTSQREGCVFLDSSGCEVYAGPNRDYRAVLEGMQLAGAHGDRIYRSTGHFPSGLFLPARLLWHKKNAPDIYARVARVLMINDWVLFRLTGECACEPSNASETCLYDLTSGCWTDDLIEALELPREIFPAILPCGARLGQVNRQAAQETGLAPGTPVVMGGADTQCGLLGAGVMSEGQTAAVSGTTTPVQMVTGSPIIDPEVRLWAGAHVVPKMYVLESNAGGSGSVYQWFRDTFCEAELAEAQRTGRDVYEIMNAGAMHAPAGAAGVQSFIGVMAMNAKTMVLPCNILQLGMAPMTTTAVSAKDLVLRAILESLAYAVRMNAEQVERVSGRKIAGLGVCGGLAKSSLYLDILAGVMRVPVSVPRWKEGTAVGAAVCAGVGAGVYRDFAEGVRALVKPDREVAPDPQLAKVYRAHYRKWMKAREALGGLPA